MIADNPKATRVSIWSEDFFTGHEQIALLDDVLNVTPDTASDTGEAVSDEMMAALRDGT